MGSNSNARRYSECAQQKSGKKSVSAYSGHPAGLARRLDFCNCVVAKYSALFAADTGWRHRPYIWSRYQLLFL